MGPGGPPKVTIYYLAILFSTASARLSDAVALSAPSQSATKRGGTSAFFALIAGAVVVGVAAFRWRVGTDYWAYAAGYRRSADTPWSSYGWTQESGFALLARMSATIHDDYATLFALASLITIGLSVLTIYKSSANFALSLVLFLITGPWLGSFNAVRQYLACAIVFAGHHLIVERRFSRYALVVGVASMFHLSAVLLILLYLVPRRIPTVRGSLAILAGALLVTEAYGRIAEVVTTVRDDPSIASSGYFQEQLDPLRVGVAIAPLVFYALATNRRQLDVRGNFYVHMLMLNAGVLLAASGSAYIARFAIYTGIFTCLAIPHLLTMRAPAVRALSVVVVVASYGIFWYAETSAIPQLANYRWVFDRTSGQ